MNDWYRIRICMCPPRTNSAADYKHAAHSDHAHVTDIQHLCEVAHLAFAIQKKGHDISLSSRSSSKQEQAATGTSLQCSHCLRCIHYMDGASLPWSTLFRCAH